MRTVLHILTVPDDPLTRRVIHDQSQLTDTSVLVADLTQPDPDYGTVVEQIFAADSVQVW